jgi:hypothetical protein
MRVNNLCRSGQFSGFYMNDAAIQELTYLTGAESAEVQSSGLRVNSVPKEGGNKFSGTFFFEGVGSGLHADNRSDALKKVLAAPPGIAFDWQVNPSFGGPIAKDKLWFYAAYKYEDARNFVASTYPDGSLAYRRLMGNYSAIGRLTWAMKSKDKIRTVRGASGQRGVLQRVCHLRERLARSRERRVGRCWVPQVDESRLSATAYRSTP